MNLSYHMTWAADNRSGLYRIQGYFSDELIFFYVFGYQEKKKIFFVEKSAFFRVCRPKPFGRNDIEELNVIVQGDH